MGGKTGFWAAALFAAAFVLGACDSEKESDKAGGQPAPASTGGDTGSATDDATRFGGKPYKIYPDGKVDFDTYLGANLYGNICFRCHGANGNGSSFAPSLVNALESISYDRFVDVVTNGITAIDSSQTEVMPSFGDSPTVMKYIDALYAFLKAVSDGALPAGNLKWTGPKNE